MTTLRDLLARKDAIRVELRSIIDAHPDGNLPDEKRTRADSLEAEATRLTDQERRVALLDDLDRRAAGGTHLPGDGGTGDASFDNLAASVTVLDVIRAQMPGVTDAGAGRAREVSAEIERRSGRKPEGLFWHMGAPSLRARMEQRIFSTTTPGGGPGSNLIQTDVSPTIIDRLREMPIVRRLGATVLSGLVGNLNVPRLKASATAQWVAESGAITASDPQTDAVSLVPNHAGGIVEISRNMIQQPSLDVAALVENDLSLILAVALDQAAINGAGGTAPAGLLTAGSGIGNVALGAAGAAPTWNALIAAIAAVDTANAMPGMGTLGWAGNAKVTSVLRRTLKTAADTASNFIMTDPTMLAGYPYQSSQNVPSNLTKAAGTNLSALLFGDWAQLVIGFWSAGDILVNPFESTAYSKGNVQIRAMMTADVAIRQPLAFCAITDMVTT
jgi:HK97 family phage major capsid protein